MVVYYTATVNSDDSLVLGDAGNENDVTLEWSRTSTGYYDTLEDESIVYSYGIDLQKEFSDGATTFEDVTFNIYNKSDGYYVIAEETSTGSGTYWVTGKTADQADATVFTPNADTGKLQVYGLEGDSYAITELSTSNGYSLLADQIVVDIATASRSIQAAVAGWTGQGYSVKGITYADDGSGDIASIMFEYDSDGDGTAEIYYWAADTNTFWTGGVGVANGGTQVTDENVVATLGNNLTGKVDMIVGNLVEGAATVDGVLATMLGSSYISSDATLKNATYYVYANETIYDTDNKSILFEKGEVMKYNGSVVKLVTDATGFASTGNVIPAGYSYYLLEQTPSTGYTTDDTKHYFRIVVESDGTVNTYACNSSGTITSSTPLSASNPVESKEPPIYGYVDVTKKMENADGTITAEPNAVFYVVKRSLVLSATGASNIDDALEIISGMSEDEREALVKTTKSWDGQANYLDKLVTDSSGYDKSVVLPKGSYVLIQTDGDDNCDLSQWSFTISKTSGKNGSTYSFKYTDPRHHAKIIISKRMTGYEKDGEEYSIPEADATFVILYASYVKESMETLSAMNEAQRQAYVSSLSSAAIAATAVTDENGQATVQVDANTTYVILQTDGDDSCALEDAETKTTAADETYPVYYSAKNEKYQKSFTITKTMSDENGNDEGAESGASFAIVKADAVTKTAAEINEMAASERAKYVNQTLSEDDIIAEITTDSDGVATWYWDEADYDGEFVVIQYGGKDGYTLMPVIYSSEATTSGLASDGKTAVMKMTVSGEHDELTSYEFSYDDKYDAWGKIAVQKTYQTGNHTWEDESGAVFTVTNSQGEVVAKAVTDATGYGVAMELDDDGNITTTEAALPVGIYYIDQISTGDGADNTDLADQEVIIITATEKDSDGNTIHETQTYTAKNAAQDYLLTVTKISSETGKAVEGASYDIVAAEAIFDADGEISVQKGAAAASLTTASDGTGDVWLPYGYYYLVETESPVTFKTGTEKIYFTLDADGITLEDGTTTAAVKEEVVADPDYTATDGTEGVLYKFYSVSITTEDEPLYGTIYVSKTGDVVTGTDEVDGFTWSAQGVAGAQYTLYAREDITNDADEVVWAADPDRENPIAVATTDEDGYAQFFWDKDGDGVAECADFYLGSYYIYETVVPDGWLPDTEEHDIVLTWDETPNATTDVDGTEGVDAYGTPSGSAVDYANSGQYILCTGEEFNALISGATTITFTTDSPASGTATTDVSSLGDESVVMWNDGNGNYYVSTCNSMQAVILNGDSSYMFYMCSGLTDITFEAADTSTVCDMSYMFYMCTGLVRLDLRLFNTGNVTNMDYMFMGCTNLETIYATEPEGEITYVYSAATSTTGITAESVGDIMDGDEITWDNFAYTRLYSADYLVDDCEESITLTEDDIASVTPSVASQDDDSLVWIDDYTYNIVVTIELSPNSAYYCTDGSYSNTITTSINVCLEQDVDLVSSEAISVTAEITETPITVDIDMYKEDGTGTPVAGAVFTLFANCDIVNADGEVIKHAGEAITSYTTMGDTAETLSFTNLPTDMYAVDGTYLAEKSNAVYCRAYGTTGSGSADECMFYVQETFVPAGHEGDDNTYYIPAKLSDYKASSDENNDGVITYTFTSINTVISFLTLEKAWDDEDNSSDRAEYVLFLAQAEGGTTYVIAVYEDIAYLFAYNGIGGQLYTSTNYTPKGVKNSALCSWDVNVYTEDSSGGKLTVWQVVLDNSFTAISGGSSFTTPFTADSGYTFTENRDLLESMTSNTAGDIYYYPTSYGWTDSNMNVWRTVNAPTTTTVSSKVTKVWDDGEDTYRPASVTVTLYQEDSKGVVKEYSSLLYSNITLSDSNDWTYSTGSVLEKYDAYGELYTYYWDEAKVTTTDGRTYTATVSKSYDDDEELWYTKIKNTLDETIPVSVTKVWEDGDDADKIRPETLYVQLYANDLLVDVNGEEVTGDTTADTAVALNSTNSWSATLKDLPKYDDTGTEITYKFREVTSAATLTVGGQTVKVTADDVSWYTGNIKTGYKASYTYSPYDSTCTAKTQTTITNTHTSNGTIVIEKKVLASDVVLYAAANNGDDPVFTFEMLQTSGTGAGNFWEIELTFDADTVTAEADANGYVTASTTITGLSYASYSVEELTQPTDWEFKEITADDAKAIDGKTVTFEISEKNSSVKLTAVYEDEYLPEGEITVSKTVAAADITAYIAKHGTNPEVTFTLTDMADSTKTYTQTVTFTSETESVNGYMTVSATFTGLSIGKYKLEETAMPSQWSFESLEGTNGTLSEDKKSITFDITKENAHDTFTAAFTDTYRTGEITVTKKVLAEELQSYGQDVDFTFVLTDENNNEVGRKTVTLEVADCAGKGSGEYVTATASFTGLEAGTYTLAEDTSELPDGWDFETLTATNGTVSSDGKSVSFVLTGSNLTNSFLAECTNSFIGNGSITIIKYSSDGKTKLNDVTYTLYDADGNVVATKTTGKDGEKDGTVVFDDLPVGTYTITETATADGLTLLADTITATIPLKMTSEELEAYEKQNVTVDLTDAIKTSDGYMFYNLVYTVTDHAEFTLPTTGTGMMRAALIIIIAGFIMVGICVVILARRDMLREQKQEMMQE